MRGVAGRGLGSEAPGVLLVPVVSASSQEKKGDVRESRAAWACCGCLGAPGALTLSLECSWRWWRRRRTGAVWSHKEEAR